MTEPLAGSVGVSTACRAGGTPRSSLYRWRREPISKEKKQHPAPPCALTEKERETVRSVLNSARFCDRAPRQVYATLLDEGRYLRSWRAMYRILAEADQTHERRRGHVRWCYKKPELLTTEPNGLWSWDITRLKGPAPWSCY
jgi:hypothetical protein